MKSGNVAVAVLGVIFRVFVVIAAIYIIYNGATMCYNYGYRVFTEPPVTEDAKYAKTATLAITAKMKPIDIGNLLESNGLVRDAKLFMLQYYASEYRKDVKPGTYEFSSAMNAEEMMEVMTGQSSTDEDESSSAGK